MVKRLTLEQLSTLHDAIYAEAERLLKHENPCKYSNGKCAGHEGGCCGGCKYLTPKGCSTKALYCKLWLCYKIADKHIDLHNRLNVLQDFAREHNLLICRASKEDVLREIIAWKLHASTKR